MTVETQKQSGGNAGDNRATLIALKRTEDSASEDYCLTPSASAEVPKPAPERPASQNLAAIRENVRDAWLLQAEIEKVGESIENPEPAAKEVTRDAKLKGESAGSGRARGSMLTIGVVAGTALLLAGLWHALRWKANNAEKSQNSEQEPTTATATTSQPPSDG